MKRINQHIIRLFYGERAGILCDDDTSSLRSDQALLKLAPHPVEGGFYRAPTRRLAKLPCAARERWAGIYYLLEPGTFSEMHQLDSDEIFHFYLGDPVEMLQLTDGRSALFTLGPICCGQHVQLVVPAGVWQARAHWRRQSSASRLHRDLASTSRLPQRSYEELASKWPRKRT